MDLSTISSMLTKQTQAVSLFVLIKIRAFHMYYSTICFSHLTALRVNSYRSRKSAFSNIQLCSPECPKETQWGPDHEGAHSLVGGQIDTYRRECPRRGGTPVSLKIPLHLPQRRGEGGLHRQSKG